MEEGLDDFKHRLESYLPSLTKSQQRIDVSPRLTLYDTPGMLWPKIAHPEDGLMLAASHAVGVNAYIDEEVATWLGGYLLAHLTRNVWEEAG